MAQRRLLRGLTQLHKQILMAHWGGATNIDIANCLNITAATVANVVRSSQGLSLIENMNKAQGAVIAEAEKVLEDIIMSPEAIELLKGIVKGKIKYE